MPKIEQMFAFVVADAGPEDEGVAAWNDPRWGWVPLVGADIARVASVRELAQSLANKTGKPLKLLRFSVREEIEVVRPKGQQ